MGFPDINSLEPLAEALGVSVLELMKSEKIVETNIQCGDADIIVTDTIKAAEHQKQVERQQEKRIILISIGVVAMLSIFALLIDNIGWSMENILFTSVGVVLPVISIILSAAPSVSRHTTILHTGIHLQHTRCRIRSYPLGIK